VTSQPENDQIPVGRTGFVHDEVDEERDDNGSYPAASLVPEAELDSDEDSADTPLSRYEADGADDDAAADVQDADDDLPSAADASLAHLDDHSDGDDHPDADDHLDADDHPDTVVVDAIGAPGSPWHDIQAMFVDDPQGSVRRAVEAAGAAVAALAELLQQRRGASAAAGSGSPGAHGDTEALREQLLSYRIFCESLADLGHQLPEPVALAT
jgi:hypothetical protein